MLSFNANEILAVGKQLERNASRFYHAAARKTDSPVIREFLEMMARVESEHETRLANFQQQLSEAEKTSQWTSSAQATVHLRAIAEGGFLEYKIDPRTRLSGKESMADILHIAVGLEENAILFFRSVSDMVPHQQGKDWIDRLIAEEQHHITLINHQIDQL